MRCQFSAPLVEKCRGTKQTFFGLRNKVYEIKMILGLNFAFSFLSICQFTLQVLKIAFELNTALQAVVVSIDPRRVYVKDPKDVEFKTIRVTNPGKGAFP